MERRIKAIKELCRITKVGGKVLVTVWAFEKEFDKVISMFYLWTPPHFGISLNTNLQRRYGTQQDVLVPWYMQKIFIQQGTGDDIGGSGGSSSSTGSMDSSKKRVDEVDTNSVPTASHGQEVEDKNTGMDAVVYKRYYHLFKKGELEEIIRDNVPEAVVEQVEYDKDNWLLIARIESRN